MQRPPVKIAGYDLDTGALSAPRTSPSSVSGFSSVVCKAPKRLPDSLAEHSGAERSDRKTHRDPLAVDMTKQMRAVVPGRDGSTKTCIS